jgi:hypothetical protein
LDRAGSRGGSGRIRPVGPETEPLSGLSERAYNLGRIYLASYRDGDLG